MVSEFDITTTDGRILHAYARGHGDITIMWHHGTPNIGTPPAPLYEAADRLGVRLIAYDRPGYGGSTPRQDRDIASAADDAATVADALGVAEFAVFGHSGGGPHALACAALLPHRVIGVVSVSGLAPFADGQWDWFAGMGPAAAAGLRAALAGRAAKEAHEASEASESEPDFLPADWTAFDGEWGWFGSVVTPALANGKAALIDDDLAYVRPWGCDPATITAPVLLVHGEADLVVPATHSRWLADQVETASLRVIPDAGHISVLPAAADDALEWLATTARR